MLVSLRRAVQDTTGGLCVCLFVCVCLCVCVCVCVCALLWTSLSDVGCCLGYLIRSEPRMWSVAGEACVTEAHAPIVCFSFLVSLWNLIIR